MTTGATAGGGWELADLGIAVEKVVWNLQRGVLADHREAGVIAQLARLRRAVAAEPGDVPEIWSDTIDLVPLYSRGSEEPTAAERAAHVAVTLYALHQQGRTKPMHKSGGSLGSASRALVNAIDREDAVRRRFQAIALADTDIGVVYHLRALVTLLRSSDVPLDYGRLADDLCALFGRHRADRVRLRWGRDFRPAMKSVDGEGFDSFNDNTTDTEK